MDEKISLNSKICNTQICKQLRNYKNIKINAKSHQYKLQINNNT